MRRNALHHKAPQHQHQEKVPNKLRNKNLKVYVLQKPFCYTLLLSQAPLTQCFCNSFLIFFKRRFKIFDSFLNNLTYIFLAISYWIGKSMQKIHVTYVVKMVLMKGSLQASGPSVSSIQRLCLPFNRPIAHNRETQIPKFVTQNHNRKFGPDRPHFAETQLRDLPC